MDRTRTKQSTKTSNIHQNFFSKRTTASNKKDEGVTGPPSAPPSHGKKLSVREKYDSRTLNNKHSVSGINENQSVQSQYVKSSSNKLNSIDTSVSKNNVAGYKSVAA